jgi:sugar phosphate isomerase/epimerase
MQLGMPTLIELKSIEACAELCRELGLGFIELNMNLPEYQANRLDVSVLRRVAEKFGIDFTIHLDENLNPCDFNNRVADAYTETVMQTIEIAKQLRIPILNMHLSKGVYFTLPEKKVFLFSEYEDVYFEKIADFRNRCETAIGGADMTICIENADGCFDMPFIVKGLDALMASPAFAMTFDIGHNAFAGGADEPVILSRANKLRHMHIHDAIGRRPHLPLGTGDLDLPKYFALANKHHCRVVLETKTIAGLKDSVEWMQQSLSTSTMH